MAATLRGLIVLVVCVVGMAMVSTASAQSPNKKGAEKPHDGSIGEYRSQHFYMHTDLSPAESKQLLETLEVMLSLVSEYWGKPSRGIIEMYVIKDLANWPPNSLDPDGRAKVEAGGGVTMTTTLQYGRGPNAEIVDAKSIVYAGADHGTPQHEAVHAYCHQTFGRVGPVWYSEGMAEVGNYWKKGQKAVDVHPVVVEYIRSTDPKTLNAIVNNREATGDSWENYAWRWALCHLLENNPNYKQRFRPFGLALLMNKPITFEETYGDMANEMSFEYLFFLEHLQNGYRADLCAFDWKKKFLPLRGNIGPSIKVLADHGWQPSQATLKEGQKYDYSCTGTWKVSNDGSMLTADGDSQGHGKLIGALMNNFELGEPFSLGSQGTLVPPEDGNLWLRCEDEWDELGDNKGSITFKLKLVP